MKKFFKKSPQKNKVPKEKKTLPQQVPEKSDENIPIVEIRVYRHKLLFWLMGGVLFAAVLIAIGWYLGHRENNYDPYVELDHISSRHQFMIKSSQLSIKMTNRAIEALKRKNIDEAIEDCKTAIDLFPIDAKPYILLTTFYLKTGQERKMYDTLTLAGNSYPNFDNIVGVIDDASLDQIPLDESQDNIYVANFPENKKTAISFMFDDGEANVYKALPAFEKYGYRATIPVVAGYVSDTSDDPFWGSWAQWRDAANRGFEIANHSMYHRDSLKLHGKDFDIAIDQAKDIIEKNIGHKVTAYVFPHDSYTDEAVRRALRSHKVIRTAEFLEPIYPRTVAVVIGGPHVAVETANRLVDIAIKRRLWLIAKCHGVSEKRTMRSFKSITPEFLNGNLAYIHSKGDDVWVDTFSNVFEYLSSRAQTQIETKSSKEDSIDFVLHNVTSRSKLSTALTVIIKATEGASVISASGADGHKLKAWSCAADKICVDVDSYDGNIHLQWDPVKSGSRL